MCIASRKFSTLFRANRRRRHSVVRRFKEFRSPSQPPQSAVFHCGSHLDLLRMLLFLNTTTADTIRAISLLEAQMFVYPSIILLCSMVFFLKDRIGLNSLKLGLEVANGTTMRTAVGATTGIGEIVAIVLRLITRGAPGGTLSSTS